MIYNNDFSRVFELSAHYPQSLDPIKKTMNPDPERARYLGIVYGFGTRLLERFLAQPIQYPIGVNSVRFWRAAIIP